MIEPANLNVQKLHIELKKRNLSPTGTKREFINWLNITLEKNIQETNSPRLRRKNSQNNVLKFSLKESQTKLSGYPSPKS
jgi:hypothetical protein